MLYSTEAENSENRTKACVILFNNQSLIQKMLRNWLTYMDHVYLK